MYLQVLDFAENYTCIHQDEIQSAHWYHDMLTIHPIVSYFRCPVCNDIKKEETVLISEDLKQDSHAVNRFTSTVIKQLQDRNYPIKKIVQFSDGAASQYKCKTSFINVSLS